ncbi:MAG: Membrane protein involved in the export of O-antigen and teichoic acid [Thermodesulfobacterium sp.]|uniref:Membrane protein involved in the export of O-antigen and teichoic acid n=1 Tax=Candidatus Thermodesulfobacterium syntrophicum TaxID=3060442 RepID=A0AAE3P1E6_9BACT|nr:Membrane protein involved in the export of O-antigen and teichoic acid [Candidatus Thermodesulfobacterium syntrophicum]
MDRQANKQRTGEKSSQLQISGKLLARNTLLNFLGQVVPLLVGVVTIPFIVQGLGTKRFGLLSLAWVVLSYFTIFDLGLGRATTKFVAEALGRCEEEQIPQIVWTAITIQAILGLLGALVLVGITPILVEHILNIPPDLVREAKATFYLLALSVPVVLASGSFRGVLEASQRFDLVNAVKIPTSALTFFLPLVGLWLGFKLPGIVVLILFARIGALVTYTIMNFHINPKLRKYPSSLSFLPHLFAFGGWVTISSIVSPVLVYLDRFLIGSLLSISAVAYYSAPYEAVTRLWIIPASLVMTIFPVFSALEGIKDRQRLGILFVRSVKYILLTLWPVVLVVMLFAKEALQIWLGDEFAAKSTLALQILALGVLINSLARIPFALLQGIGRPDIPAKFHLLELPFYIGIAYLLVSHWGIAGAATAWTIRVAVDTLLLFVAAFKISRLSPCLLITNGLILEIFLLLLLGGLAYALRCLTDTFSLLIQVILFGVLFSIFAWFFWRIVLDALDRDIILKVVKIWHR